MSPKSASMAEKFGYTNVKVYHDGLPEWNKKNYTALSPQSLKEAWIDKGMPYVLLDVRPAKDSQKGFIKGAVTLPASEVAANVSKFPPREKKPPIIIYDDKAGDDAKSAARALISAGYTSVSLVTGGMDAWKTANYPVESGNLAANIVYTPKPRPGEISLDDFKMIAAAVPADTVILDVRTPDEANAGMIKGAKIVPQEDVLSRLSDIPRDKQIIAYCNTGVRAEMAYHALKDNGYNVKFLNAKITFDKDKNFTIEKL